MMGGTMRKRLRILWDRLLKDTIWAHGAIPEEEQKYRNLKRVFLPIADLFLVGSGIGAVVHGAPSITLLFATPVLEMYAWSFLIASILCLVSIAIPRMWAWELAGKTILVGLLATYVLILWFLAGSTGGSRWFLSGVAAAFVSLLIWRITIIADEWGDRRAASEIYVSEKLRG